MFAHTFQIMVQGSKAVIRVNDRRGLSLTPSANEIKRILSVKAVVVESVIWYFAVISGILLGSQEPSCVGISGGCASMRNAPDLRIQGTFPIFIVFVRSSGYFTFIPFHFVVYSIYTSICIVATYPFVLWRDQGQPEIISFILSRWCDLANEYAYRFDFNIMQLARGDTKLYAETCR